MGSRSSIALPLSVLVSGALLLTACTSTKHPAATATSSGSGLASGPASSAAASGRRPQRRRRAASPVASSPTRRHRPPASSAASAVVVRRRRSSGRDLADVPPRRGPHRQCGQGACRDRAQGGRHLKARRRAVREPAGFARRQGKSHHRGDREQHALRSARQRRASSGRGTSVRPSMVRSLPCGNINPTGITGTPVYDPATGLVFAVAFLAGNHHELVAVDAETGAVAWTRPVDPPGSHPEVEQERGALLLSNGVVWVPFGGLYGDCGPYHGYMVGVPTSGPSGAAAIYQVPSAREAGIWTPAGAAADSAGHVYVSVGNGAQTNPKAAYDTERLGDRVAGHEGRFVLRAGVVGGRKRGRPRPRHHRPVAVAEQPGLRRGQGRQRLSAEARRARWRRRRGAGDRTVHGVRRRRVHRRHDHRAVHRRRACGESLGLDDDADVARVAARITDRRRRRRAQRRRAARCSRSTRLPARSRRRCRSAVRRRAS